MKTLILSCNTGEGHNSCARAIKEYYDSKKEECVIADGLGFISHTTSDVMSRGHSYIYKHLPWLSRHGYSYAESHTAYYGENTPLYKYFTQGGEKLYRYISLGGFDCVICTHVFTAFMLTRMLEEYPIKLATCFVATDYSSYPAIEKSDLDVYFVPDESLIPVYTEHGIPREKLSVSGIPVRKMFYEKRPADEAKLAVGIDPMHKHLLIMCGSMGCGPMKQVLRGLSQKSGEKIDISVVCGNNSELKSSLSKQYADNKNIHIRGFVEDMSLLMESADLYLTKPGGISTCEAAQMELPMVLIDAVAGVEKYNMSFFVESGGAVTANTTSELCDLCLSLLKDDGLRDSMRKKLSGIKKSQAAATIYDTMKDYEKEVKTRV
ncbi:MAG: polysaccharide biosynthesis protein [Clostridia bacterium]|nr:polysaccharide biosynthesis protein [Clostridia bacterium]